MGTYDLKRLEVAIQYIKRMSEGRNPVTNRPAPENEILTNVNVNRCLKFVEEILSDVHGAGGQVGAVPRKAQAPGPSLAEIFPYEILGGFRYVQDQQISYLLRQIQELLPEEKELSLPAVKITNWLRENGYLEKKTINETGKENSLPTQKGLDMGMYTEKAGTFPNEYYRVYYNENAQRFLVENFQKILTETEDLQKKRKSERKTPKGPEQPAAGKQGPAPERQYGGPVPDRAGVFSNPDPGFMDGAWEPVDEGLPW